MNEFTYETAVVVMDADFNTSIEYRDEVQTNSRKEAVAIAKKYIKIAEKGGYDVNCYIAVLQYDEDGDYVDHVIYSDYYKANTGERIPS